MKRKQSMSVDKHQWHPSLLPGLVVIVSTVDIDGSPNIAPKSWVTMAAFKGPLVSVGCNVEHTTYQNIIATQSFVINIPDASLADRVWALPSRYGADRMENGGFTLCPPEEVAVPRVAECYGHLECVLDRVITFEPEVMIIGRIVSASIDADLLQGENRERYAHMRPFFFLEDRTYGVIEEAKSVST